MALLVCREEKWRGSSANTNSTGWPNQLTPLNMIRHQMKFQPGECSTPLGNGSPDIRLNRLDEGDGERMTRLNQWRQPALVWRVWLRGIIHRLDARWR